MMPIYASSTLAPRLGQHCQGPTTRGHVAGAAFLDVASARSVLSDPHAPLRWTWPSQEHFEVVMGRAGVGNDSHVVRYASTAGQRIYNNTMWCTRAWWIMHHFGVRAGGAGS
jgi:3-mercaptopyruvate sulfurtransferase SseA